MANKDIQLFGMTGQNIFRNKVGGAVKSYITGGLPFHVRYRQCTFKSYLPLGKTEVVRMGPVIPHEAVATGRCAGSRRRASQGDSAL